MKIPVPRWAQVKLSSALSLAKSRMAADDPMTALVAALIEIGDSLDEMTTRVEQSADSTTDIWHRSVTALQITMREIATKKAVSDKRDARHTVRLVAAIVAVATIAIIATIFWTRPPAGACLSSPAPAETHRQ